MSKQLLYNLTRGYRGSLHKYLDGLEEEPRIAYYASACQDYRPLLYLSEDYAALYPSAIPEPLPPNIFLFTDYFPWHDPGFHEGQILFKDERMEISVLSLEELPRQELPLHQEIVAFPEIRNQTGRSFFMRIRVTSHRLKERICPLIYVVAENEAFCAEVILPSEGKMSHIIHVRYGGGCGGGGMATGVWMLNILDRLGCTTFITDGQYEIQQGDLFAMTCYHELSGPCRTPPGKTIRVTESKYWSGHGDVQWNLLE